MWRWAPRPWCTLWPPGRCTKYPSHCGVRTSVCWKIARNVVAYSTQVTDCATEDGWHYLDPGISLELCGAACRDYQSAGVLDAQYRCGSFDDNC